MGNLLKREIPQIWKVHFRSAHKEANLAYLNKVKDNDKPPSPETEANPGTWLGSMTETTVGQRTLQQCFHRRTDSCCLVNTQEPHRNRRNQWEEALVKIKLENPL